METRRRMSAPERRRQLAELAARQFHQVGFHRVTLASVATAGGVTPPAIYRHFANKQALLVAAVDSGLRRVEEVVVSEPDATLERRLEQLADAAAERRDVWVLLQREMRHIREPDRRPLTLRFARFAERMRVELSAARPDLGEGETRLLLTALLAVLSSQATYPARFPLGERRRILGAVAAGMATEGLRSVPREAGGAAPSAVPLPSSKGDELLAAAIALFHERGYDAVSLDDIGARAGISGPSVLHHFPTKSSLLVAAFERATAELAGLRAHAADGPLERLVEGYAAFAVRSRLLLGVYVLESVGLPTDVARSIAEELRRDTESWRESLRRERPELTDAELTLLVHASRAVVHDVVRVGRLHERPEIAAEIVQLMLGVLGTDLSSARTAGP